MRNMSVLQIKLLENRVGYDGMSGISGNRSSLEISYLLTTW